MSNESKISYEEFVERSIRTLRKPPHKGIHVVFSKFNEAFRQYYNEEPRPIIEKLVEDGFLRSRPARGGAMIMLSSDSKEKSEKTAGKATSDVLAKILSQS